MKRYMPIFVLPTFCAFILGFIVPFAMGIWLSFCKFTTVTDAKFVCRAGGGFVHLLRHRPAPADAGQRPGGLPADARP